MKKNKILLILTLCLSLFSVDKVFADECTDDMIKEYEQYANQIVITPTRLGDSETFEIWVKNVTNNLAVENGRTVFNSGFLGYAKSGENFIARVYVRSGACREVTIKEIKVTLPDVVEECDDCNNSEDTTPPTVVEKPTTDTTKNEKEETTTDTSKDEKEEPTTDSSKNEKEEPTIDTSKNEKEEPITDTSKNEKEESTTDTSKGEKEEPTTDTSKNEKEEITTDNSENEKEEPITDNTKNDKEDVNENTNLDSEVNNGEIIKNVVIFSTVTFLAVILYYIIKKKKFSK